jgi:hypothetical protein
MQTGSRHLADLTHATDRENPEAKIKESKATKTVMTCLCAANYEIQQSQHYTRIAVH